MKKIFLEFVRTGKTDPENVPMSPARRAKYDSIKNDGARAQHLASSAAIYATAGDAALTFVYGENGRPQIDGGYVSPAHTEGMAVCAYAGVPVGCDIEIASRKLNSAMARQFGALDDWLALEACVKMTGEGLSGIRKYRRCGGEMLDASGARIAYVRFFDYGEYRLAVCCGEEFEVKI